MPFAALLALAAATSAQPVFEISFDAQRRAEPADGRLVLFLIREGSKIDATAAPADGPYWEDPQPMFGVTVRNLIPGMPALIDDFATSFPGPLSGLAPGRYRAQAVLDVNRDDSNWRREPGNLFSDPIQVDLDPARPARIPIKLTRIVEPARPPATGPAELFEIRSVLLSEFHGRDIKLRAGVLPPLDRDPARAYAAIYEVPGFGSNHEEAWDVAHPFRARLPAGSPWIDIRRNAAYIILDPESGNGHTLFADSANNGPCGRALVEELIPALEKKYNLVARPEARLLRGHSSGGWSTLWLSITYPQTFGACWSSSPDPVDFRRFQLPDLYADESMYRVWPMDLLRPPLDRYTRAASYLVESPAPDGPRDIASTRSGGRADMSIATENAIEEVLGPDNTSGQQWDSWQAVFGPRNARGNPAALYDAISGRIDREIAAQYRAYDIADRTRNDQGNLGLLFQQRIRLIVGDQDTYFLNEAVELLRPDIEKLRFFHYPEGQNGYIRIIPGCDHGTIFRSDAMNAFPAEMLNHLRRHGFIAAGDPAPTPPAPVPEPSP